MTIAKNRNVDGAGFGFSAEPYDDTPDTPPACNVERCRARYRRARAATFNLVDADKAPKLAEKVRASWGKMVREGKKEGWEPSHWAAMAECDYYYWMNRVQDWVSDIEYPF